MKSVCARSLTGMMSPSIDACLRQGCWLTWILLLVFLLPSGPSLANEEERVRGEPYVVYGGDILTFSDGDREQVVLEHIDAPESAQLCQRANGAFYPCGRFAINALSDRIGPETITCVGSERDAKGRLIGQCRFANGTDLQAWMVEQGYAVATSDRYAAEEVTAKAAQRGVWQGRFVRPAAWRAGERVQVHPRDGCRPGIAVHWSHDRIQETVTIEKIVAEEVCHWMGAHAGIVSNFLVEFRKDHQVVWTSHHFWMPHNVSETLRFEGDSEVGKPWKYVFVRIERYPVEPHQIDQYIIRHRRVAHIFSVGPITSEMIQEAQSFE